MPGEVSKTRSTAAASSALSGRRWWDSGAALRAMRAIQPSPAPLAHAVGVDHIERVRWKEALLYLNRTRRIRPRRSSRAISCDCANDLRYVREAPRLMSTYTETPRASKCSQKHSSRSGTTDLSWWMMIWYSNYLTTYDHDESWRHPPTDTGRILLHYCQHAYIQSITIY